LKSISLHWFIVLFVLLCAVFVPASLGQQAPVQSARPLSADEMIRILQENPDVLEESRALIGDSLRQRGFALADSDISDDRLFTEIRSDQRIRVLLNDELKNKGFTPLTSAPNGAREQGGLLPRTTPSPAIDPSGGVASGVGGRGIGESGERDANRERTNASRSGFPYANLPALQDLYSQVSPDQEKVERFGAALFRNAISLSEKDKVGFDVPAGSDYVLGPGDELVVEYWGSTSQRLQVSIDRSGRVSLPEAGTVLVSGQTLAEAQRLIERALARQFKNVSVNLSLGHIRTVRVYIVGDVKNPGAYDISSLSTALSALLAAGGPADSGSMRLVRHYRGKALLEEIDLYELMLKGVSSGQQRIESGDSILVPPVGSQVTVAGTVRRPAIYELHSERTLDEVLDLAGGVPVSGQLETMKVERVEAHERKVMLSVDLPQGGNPSVAEDGFKKFLIQDGDRVVVSSILPYSEQTVYLQGHVFRPGKYPFRNGLTLTDLIASFQDVLPEPADRAEIVRLLPPDYRPSVIGFSLRAVLENRQPPLSLQPFDTVRIYGRYESDAPKVAIYGEVLRPGEYPLSERMSAADLLRMAGGFKRDAFTEAADLASYAVIHGDHVESEHREIPIERALAGEPDTDVLLKPGDVLNIRQLGGWKDIGGEIVLNGEVLHPGRYGIQPGERLSSIVKRAGGFLPDAYPSGAILEREQVKQLSAKSRDDLISKLQAQAVEGSGAGQAENAAVARQRQQLIDRLKQIQPSGRLVIRVSPQVEKWENGTADIEVRSGDVLTVPKRPNFVLVAGQVYSPTAITYAPGKNAGWYLRQAGGATDFGNQKDIFVVRSNGSVIGRSSSQWWTGNVLTTVLQPGDTLYVPERFVGSDKLKLFSESAQVLSGLAVAARVAISF